MGIDFLRKTKPVFERRETERLRELASPSLFSGKRELIRIFPAHLQSTHSPIHPGMLCIMYLKDDELRIYNGDSWVATVTTPPKWISDVMLGPAHGVASVVIHSVSEIAEMVELEINQHS
jgi:hypothetical protein